MSYVILDYNVLVHNVLPSLPLRLHLFLLISLHFRTQRAPTLPVLLPVWLLLVCISNAPLLSLLCSTVLLSSVWLLYCRFVVSLLSSGIFTPVLLLASVLFSSVLFATVLCTLFLFCLVLHCSLFSHWKCLSVLCEVTCVPRRPAAALLDVGICNNKVSCKKWLYFYICTDETDEFKVMIFLIFCHKVMEQLLSKWFCKRRLIPGMVEREANLMSCFAGHLPSFDVMLGQSCLKVKNALQLTGPPHSHSLWHLRNSCS